MKRPRPNFREVYERYLALSFQEKGHMSTELLHHVFGSLQGLEKCVNDSRSSLKAVHEGHENLEHDLNEGERVIGEMRKVANKLQLDLAKKDWKNIIRTLHIFYGMLSMARPAVLRAYSQLANTEIPSTRRVEPAALH